MPDNTTEVARHSRYENETVPVSEHAKRKADEAGVSDAGVAIGRYDGPDAFTVWEDETADGAILFGTVWDKPSDTGELRQVWDAVWSGGCLVMGYDRSDIGQHAKRQLLLKGILSTDGGAGVEKMRAGAIDWPPVIGVALSFIPDLDP